MVNSRKPQRGYSYASNIALWENVGHDLIFKGALFIGGGIAILLVARLFK